MTDKNDSVLIVGGGPAGFGAALAFHNNDYKNITVLEGRADIVFDEENSYPVGINVRGRDAIKNLFDKSDHKPDTLSIGLRVDQWKILVGPGINVANFDSGLVISSSRAAVTNLLYDEVKKHDHIKVLFNHKAKSVDLKNRTLTCELENGEEKTFQPSCLIIADGYRSKVRDSLAQQEKSLKVDKWSWNDKFRMLITNSNKQTDLSPFVHYIFNRIYVSKFLSGRWTAGISIQENSPEFLLSNDPSDENVKSLRAYIKKLAPSAEKLFSDEELRDYFSRAVFGGAVIKVSKLNIHNWALLLGDAAHSTIPATGEGINSALEDCYVLQKCLQSNKNLADSLIEYEKERLVDVNALSDIAYSLARPNFKSSIQMIAFSSLKKCKLMGPSREDLMFGKNSSVIQRYSTIYKIWLNQAKWFGGANIPIKN
jgi:kynurenine 3-monooxygenase